MVQAAGGPGKTLTRKQYDEYKGFITGAAIARRFGTWNKSLERAGLKPCWVVNASDDHYFSVIKTVWDKLGRQLTYNEMDRYSAGKTATGISKHFGTWRKALEAFSASMQDDKSVGYTTTEKKVATKDSRDVNWRLRYLVFRRDAFRCKACGKSPATDPSVELHADHVLPRSKGGRTHIDNLQTLCNVCNIGKSDT